MPMSPALRHKLAILGATYARALENAATRGGRALSPAMSDKLTAIRAQPQARLQHGLGDMFREHATGGELPMTPQRAQMQDLARRMPWASDEHTSDAMSAKAEDRFNRLLDRRGLSSQTPAGQPSTHEQINRTFGDPAEFRRALYRADEPQVRAPAGPTAVLPVQVPAGPTSVLPVNTPPAAVTHALTNPGSSRARAMTRDAATPATPTPSAAPRQFPRARFQMGKVGSALPKIPGLPALAGAGIPLALGGAMLARKPGVQASIRAMQEGGSTEERDKAGVIPQEALDQADAIHQALLAHGVDPASVRMGIDAPPGSGKTTLAKAIQQKAGVKHYGLDWLPGNALHSTVGLGRNIEKMPRAPHAGEVLEHYMLGRTYDPELFDAMVHIRRDPEVLKQQLQQRGHGAYIGDTMDLNKSLGVADLGFDTLGGEVIDLGNGVQMKLRPREGWGNALDDQLAQRGIDAHDLSRHEKLLSLHAGQRTTGAGWTPYAKNPFSTGETLALGASIPLGIMAAKRLAGAVPKVAFEEKDAGVMDALRRIGTGIRNQTNSLNMHLGQAMANANPHAPLNPTLPVPGVGAATTGAINFMASKIPGRVGGWVAKGLDAAAPSANPQGFGARKLIGHAVDTLAPGVGLAGTAVTEGLVHGIPAALKRVVPSAAPHAGALLKETL